ncbi:MAG: hypothetical protein AAFN76_00315 [Pseudomonadota bacterium]
MPSVIHGSGPCVFAFGGTTEIASLACFLNLSGITWIALAGQALYGIVMVAIFKMQDRNRDSVMK